MRVVVKKICVNGMMGVIVIVFKEVVEIVFQFENVVEMVFVQEISIFGDGNKYIVFIDFGYKKFIVLLFVK